MAVFGVEKTRDYTVMSNHHLRNAGAVAEIQKATLHDAVLAGGLEYTTKGAAQNLQGGHGQHQIRFEGTVVRQVHHTQLSPG